jgi:hypothetical protein
MPVRTIAVAVACLGVLGFSGCGNAVESCGTGDNAVARQRGFAMPRQALRSFLAANPPLSEDGWIAASRTGSLY